MHASLSEDGILGLLARHFPATHPSLLLGRGDDCAILRAGRPLCVSSDLFLEDGEAWGRCFVDRHVPFFPSHIHMASV